MTGQQYRVVADRDKGDDPIEQWRASGVAYFENRAHGEVGKWWLNQIRHVFGAESLAAVRIDPSTIRDVTPPSIPDMVPGTTFTAERNGFRIGFMRVDRGPGRFGPIAIDVLGRRWGIEDIDPSTIRDVTAPAVSS